MQERLVQLLDALLHIGVAQCRGGLHGDAVLVGEGKEALGCC